MGTAGCERDGNGTDRKRRPSFAAAPEPDIRRLALGFRPPRGPARTRCGTGAARRAARFLERAGVGGRTTGQAGGTGGTGQRIVADSRVSAQLTAHLTAEERVAQLHAQDPERQLSWPALPPVVVAVAGFVLGAGFYRGFTGHDALFPSGTVGWALAVLTGVIVGHLVALGRARWWGGTGSGAALTLAVLLLYGWVPAAWSASPSSSWSA